MIILLQITDTKVIQLDLSIAFTASGYPIYPRSARQLEQDWPTLYAAAAATAATASAEVMIWHSWEERLKRLMKESILHMYVCLLLHHYCKQNVPTATESAPTVGFDSVRTCPTQQCCQLDFFFLEGSKNELSFKHLAICKIIFIAISTLYSVTFNT